MKLRPQRRANALQLRHARHRMVALAQVLADKTVIAISSTAIPMTTSNSVAKRTGPLVYDAMRPMIVRICHRPSNGRGVRAKGAVYTRRPRSLLATAVVCLNNRACGTPRTASISADG